MPAPGATPIILYNSSTASAVPSAANLTPGELAVNIADKKIYTKNGGGSIVTLLGSLGSQEANAVAITGGSITGITDLAIADGGTGASTASGARTNLGLGTIATQAASNVSITGGSITGITDLAVADGGTGASTADAARVNLNVITATTGSEKVPAGTTAQRDVSPAAGYFRFNSTLGTFEGYNGTAWGSVGGGATGAGGDEVFVENEVVVTTSYTLTTGKNAMSTGPITLNSGVTVTVPTGARWVVLQE